MENMAPGYRFYPTEEELISFYLMNKLKGERDEEMNRVIPVLDIYDYNPSQLPQVSGEASVREREQWFFFIPRQESEARGGRPKRLTSSGYWKATGSPNHVYSSDNRIIGMKRTMVFYNGRAPNGTKTDWKMNEYKAILHPHPSSSTPMLRQEYSLCRVYKKSKCLRSFDRRPPPRRESGAAASSGMNMNPAGIERAEPEPEPESKEGLTSTTSSYHPQGMERGVSIASSPESSSSGDQAQAYLDDEPLLDWEQVDWFLWDHQKPI